MITYNAFIKRISKIVYILLLPACFLMSGCDDVPTDFKQETEKPVLTAYLETGRMVQQVRLDRIGSFDHFYDRDYLGINGAEVVIYVLKNDQGKQIDSTGKAIYFSNSEDTSGVYIPVNPEAFIPRGSWTYRIEAFHANFEELIWAETTMPDSFSFEIENYPVLLPPQADTLIFNKDNDPIRVNWTESRNSGGFLFLNTCIDTQNVFIPVNPDWDPDDDDEGKEYDRFYWSLNPESQRSMRIPWISYKWVGLYQTHFMSLSSDYYEYIKSIMNNDDSDEHLPIESNVNGGLGIFGGLCNHSFNLIMTRVE